MLGVSLRALGAAVPGLGRAGAANPNAWPECRAARRLLRTSAALLGRPLPALEQKANRRPQDAGAQGKYLRGLNEAGFHEEVFKRVASGQFTNLGGGVPTEFAKACAATGRLPTWAQEDLAIALTQAQGQVRGVQSLIASPGAFAAENAAGGAAAPAGAAHVPRPPTPYGGGSMGDLARSGMHLGAGASGGYGDAGAAAAAGSATLGTSGNPMFFRQSVSWVEALSNFARGLMSLAIMWMVMSMLWKFNSDKADGKGKGGPGGGGLMEMLQGGGAKPEEAVVPDTRFEDVKGCDHAKKELTDIVEFLRNPDKYRQFGAKVPKGVLLSGPPGTGKTLLARAMAGEAGVKFYAKSASEFEEVFVGLGAQRMRKLFETAKENAPAIVFLDEIDALGSRRDRFGGGTSRQTLNQLLTQMDGFEKDTEVIVIAATNDPDALDSALQRAGRFDYKVSVPRPDRKGRRELLELYLSRVSASDNIDADLVARATPGMTGADIATMVNSAALLAAHAGKEELDVMDLDEARDKVWMGPPMQRKRTKHDTTNTAYHEAGHALVGLLTKNITQDLYKVTIQQRGQALGVTWFLPQEEELPTRASTLANIDMALGGRLAEELTFGADRTTVGASNDLQNATNMARQFVMQYGLGDTLAVYSKDQNSTRPSHHEDARIDREVEGILRAAHGRAKDLLTTHQRELKLLAEALLEYETLSAEEVRRVIRGEKLPPKEELIAERRQKTVAELSKPGSAAAAAASGAGGGEGGGWFGWGRGDKAPAAPQPAKAASEAAEAAAEPASSPAPVRPPRPSDHPAKPLATPARQQPKQAEQEGQVSPAGRRLAAAAAAAAAATDKKKDKPAEEDEWQ